MDHVLLMSKLQKVDLAVSNSKIQEIGDLKNLKAKETIDAGGFNSFTRRY